MSDTEQKPAATISPQHAKLVRELAELRLQRPDEQESAFTTRELVIATLPHKNPGNVAAWQRRNGNFSLVIRPGWNHDKGAPYGYPYGTIPRLLLYWITTEALYTNNPRLELGESLNGFLRDIGLDPLTGGGPRSDARRLRDQMQRLFRAIISFNYTDSQRHSWLDMQVAPEGVLWWDTKQPDQQTLWKSWIELSPQFFRALTAAPVPVNLGILRALKRSPLALDLYAWASYTAFQASQTGKARFVPWRSLHQQFGAEYGNVSDFRRKAKAALTKITAAYHGLQIGDRDGGIEILPTSGPSIAPRPARRSLPNPKAAD